MIICIHDVPRYERHLLFCSNPSVTHPGPQQSETYEDLAAINRSPPR